MKRLIKIIAWLLGLAVLTLAAAAIIIPLVVDPNEYRDEIESLVQKQTGRELDIEGRIELSLFPWLGVELGAMQLSNAEGFGPEPFARIERVDVHIKLLPLLRKQVEMDTLTLHGLQLDLGRDAEGRGNWEDLVAAPAAETPAQPAQPEKEAVPQGSPAQALAALAIGGIEIRDAKAVWDDRASGQRASIERLNLESGAIALKQPFPLSLAFDLALNQPELSGHVALKTEITLDLDAQRYRLAGTQLDTDLQSPLIPGGRAAAQLKAEIEADLAAQTAKLDKLRLTGMGVELGGQVAARNLLELPGAEGSLQLKLTDAKALLAPFADALPPGIDLAGLTGTRLSTVFQADLKGQTARLEQTTLDGLGLHLALTAEAEQIIDGPKATGRIELTVKDGAKALGPVKAQLPPGLKPAALSGARLQTPFSFDLKAQQASLKPLTLEALALALTAEVEASKLMETPQLAGRLELGEFVPRDTLNSLGIALPEMADPDTLSKASLRLGFDASPEHAALKGLKLRFDDSSLSGSLSARNFAAPVLRYDLNLDAIDADRYLPPPSEEEAVPTVATPASAAAAGAVQLPLELLRSLDIDGSVKVGKLKVKNLRSRQIHATLKAAKGLYRLYPVGARLYSGSYQGNLTFDVRRDTPRLAMDEHLAGVEAGPLLKDFLGKDYVSGTATVNAKLRASGIEPMAVRKSLSGNADFRFANGAVNGINIGQLIRNAYAALQGQPQPPEETKKSDFAELKGSVRIKNGRVRNDDLSAKSPLLRVRGKGEAHLVKETVDYRVEAAIVGSMQGQGGKEIDDLKNITVPIRISGTFTDPKFSVELGAALQEKARAALEAEKAKAQQALEAEKARAQKELERKKRELEAAKKKREQELKAQLEAERKQAEQEQQQKLEEEKKRLEKELEEKLKNSIKF